MITIGLSEIQKNISIFSTLNEPLKIVDKRKKITLAIVYPVNKAGKLKELAGKFEKRIDPTLKNIPIQEAKDKAYEKAMKEKYARSD